MNQGIRLVRFMKKTRGRKSRETIPLKLPRHRLIPLLTYVKSRETLPLIVILDKSANERSFYSLAGRRWFIIQIYIIHTVHIPP
jgi:hypothetical protein